MVKKPPWKLSNTCNQSKWQNDDHQVTINNDDYGFSIICLANGRDFIVITCSKKTITDQLKKTLQIYYVFGIIFIFLIMKKMMELPKI